VAQDQKPPAIITLTTDFGHGSRYVGAMKGVILSINPRATIVDLSHAVPPRDIRAGAILLAETATWFPPNTIHVAVVDPGVGSKRRIIYAEIGNQRFVAPDNGLLSRLAMGQRPSKMISVDEPRHWLPDVSRTFHGRDIMAPVAARLSLGLAPEELGKDQQHIVEIPWAEVEQVSNRIDGEVIEIDSFGNLITNITRSMLDGLPSRDAVLVSCEDHETQELAIVDENASAMLGVKVGAPVRVSW
jgi:S-adenosyl-L-methionine hydrolase (adenosine-forming)